MWDEKAQWQAGQIAATTATTTNTVTATTTTTTAHTSTTTAVKVSINTLEGRTELLVRVDHSQPSCKIDAARKKPIALSAGRDIRSYLETCRSYIE